MFFLFFCWLSTPNHTDPQPLLLALCRRVGGYAGLECKAYVRSLCCGKIREALVDAGFLVSASGCGVLGFALEVVIARAGAGIMVGVYELHSEPCGAAVKPEEGDFQCCVSSVWFSTW
jgi:hypothetical protein